MLVIMVPSARGAQLFHITIVSYYCYLFLRLLEVRGRYYELLTHCIPPDIIFKVTKRERDKRK